MRRLRAVTIPIATATALIGGALVSCGARGTGSSTSRAATFLQLVRGETLLVERVRDVPGGFEGEVATTSGAVWFRYRVRLGPGETIERYEMDMTSMVGARPGDIPRPVLVARHVGDSVIIVPEPGMHWSGRRVAVPRTAQMASFEMTSLEQTVRHGLNLGAVPFATVSPWVGQAWNAIVTPLADKRVRVETDDGGAWELTLDPERRILRGSGIRGPLSGLEIVRLDPSRDHPLHRPLSITGSVEGARRVRLDSLMGAWSAREGTFRAALGAGTIEQQAASLDRQIVGFADRGGVYQAERCLEAAAHMRRQPGGPALALRYARWAVACADSHQVRWFGDQGMVKARMTSRVTLAEILSDLGRRDSAILLLEEAVRLPPDHALTPLQRDVRVALAGVLAAEGRNEDAIASLFEAVALDTTGRWVAASVEEPLQGPWSRRFGGDTTLATRIARARGRKWSSSLFGGGGRDLKGAPVPEWSGMDLRGVRHSSRSHPGRPLVIVFWGGWSAPNLRVLQLAEDWHRRRAQTGVDVLTFNWELPGPGPVSERLARSAVESRALGVPVVLDHDGGSLRRYGGEAYPQIFMIDRRGRMLRTVFGGFWTDQRLTALVAELAQESR